ncbi:F-box/kelch-repeat protein At3g06240-like [Mercurialis annua]|uniref:F-box/kelch-repeat protein At3g06240-like n=1 Tax=Mercurialis annua TaxID=3986 RepID=UPI0024ADBF4D|nr:F-box/kelch-repeat protein At3g06240-like [Mercurialis annua]XP_055962379.1 F-box/kelch-repeat protein At3g06240-like [Mercurialis annua]
MLMKRTEMSEYLPEEVIFQILLRLPVKSLLKFTCVCKLWNSIIRTPHFISNQIHTTFSSNKHHRFIFLLHSYKSNYEFSMHFDNKDFDQYLPVQPLFNQADACDVVGSSNGLVCLFYVYKMNINFNGGICKFVIWNPSIRKYLLLPETSFPLLASNYFSNQSKLLGFGFDSRFNDYKLFVAQYSTSTIDVVLYSLNSNTWKKIANVPPTSYRNHICSTCRSTFVNGKFYWHPYETSKKLVLVFDLRDEMFGEIILPTQCLENHRWNFQIKAFGESSVAIIIRNNLYENDIWVMKEYDSGEWMKLARVGKRWRGFSNVLEFRDNGEILAHFCRGQRLASYNLNGRIKNLLALSEEKYGRPPFAYRHVESLALFDKGNDISNELSISF